MPNHPLVSVIIPTKNEERNIVRCLKSVKNQDYNLPAGRQGVEIIIIDNRSTDRTVELARPYTKKVIIAGHERSEQRNIGAKKAIGHYLLFLDADMQLTKTAISECLEITGKKTILAINEEATGKSFWSKALALEKRCYQKEAGFIHSARFFPRKDFLTLGGYDENLVAGEDWDLTGRFIKSGFTLMMTEKSYVIHHEPDLDLASLLKKEIYYIKNIKRYSQKNPKTFEYQKNPFYRLSIYLKSWSLLLPYPILTFGFIFYKFLVFILWKTIR